MVKKLIMISNLFIATCLFSADTNTSTIAHISAQLNAIKRSWNESRVRIKLLQKASYSLFQQLSPLFDKIIASNTFVTKMNQTVDQQVNSIVNQSMSFYSVKTNVKLSDFYPVSMHQFGQTLFSAMAQKAYCYLLGQKLVDKVKEMQQQQPQNI